MFIVCSANRHFPLRTIYQAKQAIAPYIRHTPLSFSPTLSERTQCPVYLKWENQQQTGSFKLRGAANRLSNLTEEERHRGVITVSTGNHGRGVAHVAQGNGNSSRHLRAGDGATAQGRGYASVGGRSCHPRADAR